MPFKEEKWWFQKKKKETKQKQKQKKKNKNQTKQIHNTEMTTCTHFASLGNPEIISWRIIFKHNNHLSHIRESSSWYWFGSFEL
jgi:hypothetical protein